jgi:hypothetical protein
MIGRIANAGRLAGIVLVLAAVALPRIAAAEQLKGLPDGEVAQWGGWRAWLVDPVGRYDHAVLGDAIEAGGLAVEHDGKRHLLRLGSDAVFEDRRVRLADLDGDGIPEAVAIKSYLDRGSAIAVYRIGVDGVTPLAESAAIGRRHRWLNIAGIADFTGRGEPMIAAVVTPHLAGSLRLYRLAGRSLQVVAGIDGLTNHILGSRDLDLARLSDIDGDGVPEIVLPALDRMSLAAVSFKTGAAVVVARAQVPAAIVALAGVDGATARVRTAQGGSVALSLRPDARRP